MDLPSDLKSAKNPNTFKLKIKENFVEICIKSKMSLLRPVIITPGTMFGVINYMSCTENNYLYIYTVVSYFFSYIFLLCQHF